MGSASNEFSIHDLQARVDLPRETLNTELKDWLDLQSPEHQAVLAKALLALANHGGGYVLIGFRHKNQGSGVSPEACLMSATHDVVNNIVKRYAEPPFHCDYTVVTASSGQKHPVVFVPAARVPTRAKADSPDQRTVRKDAYYTRRPGPESSIPQSGQEWDDFLQHFVLLKSDELVSNIRSVIAKGEQPPSKKKQSILEKLNHWTVESEDRMRTAAGNKELFNLGFFQVECCIEDAVPDLGLAKLKRLLEENSLHLTGWPPWTIINTEQFKPKPDADSIQCLIDTPGTSLGGAHREFWRVSKSGKFFLRSNLDDDMSPQIEPKKYLDAYLPIWRCGEILLQAANFGRKIMGRECVMVFDFLWFGLQNRVLTNWASRHRLLPIAPQIHEQAKRAQVEINSGQIDIILPETVGQLLTPLYDGFDFFEMPLQVVKEELDQLRHWRGRLNDGQ